MINDANSGTTAQTRIGKLLARNLAAANMLGRLQVMASVFRKTGKRAPVAPGTALIARFDDASDASTVTAGFSLDLPNQGAVAYIENLTPVTKAIFDGLSSQYQRLAFTIAGVNDVRLIAKIRDALAQNAQSGGTRDDFAAAVDKITSEAGVAELTAFEIDTVFTTNMQKAYSLGRFEQMSDPGVMSALPYWQYWTVGDDRVRPEHAVLDGFTARAEDPVWRKIYPPNGFNCRCSVVPILKTEAPEDADEPGYARLPLLAQLKVPQPGFGKVFDVRG